MKVSGLKIYFIEITFIKTQGVRENIAGKVFDLHPTNMDLILSTLRSPEHFRSDL